MSHADALRCSSRLGLAWLASCLLDHPGYSYPAPACDVPEVSSARFPAVSAPVALPRGERFVPDPQALAEWRELHQFIAPCCRPTALQLGVHYRTENGIVRSAAQVALPILLHRASRLASRLRLASTRAGTLRLLSRECHRPCTRATTAFEDGILALCDGQPAVALSLLEPWLTPGHRARITRFGHAALVVFPDPDAPATSLCPGTQTCR